MHKYEETELTTATTRRGPKDKYFRRNAAASVLGVELNGQSWKQLKPQLAELPAEQQEEYERLVNKFRQHGVPRATTDTPAKPEPAPEREATSAPKKATTARRSGAKKPNPKRSSKSKSKAVTGSVADAIKAQAARAAGEVK